MTFHSFYDIVKERDRQTDREVKTLSSFHYLSQSEEDTGCGGDGLILGIWFQNGNIHTWYVRTLYLYTK